MYKPIYALAVNVVDDEMAMKGYIKLLVAVFSV